MDIPLPNKTINSSICKYYPIDNNCKNLYNSLIGNCLWFSDPAGFNDPYDLNIRIEIPNYRKNEIGELAKKMANSSVGPKRSFDQIMAHYGDNLEALRDGFQKGADNITKRVGVCCFSAREDLLLMWSHYGSGHRGVCLKFDISGEQKTFLVPVEMEYQEQYPIFDYLHLSNTDYGLLQFLVGTKSKDWEYEREVRIVKETVRGKVPFDKKCLTEVIFGYKADPELVSNLKKLVVSTGYTCSFFIMKLKKGVFGLEKEPL